MNKYQRRIENTIAYVSPGWAASRAKSRNNYHVLNSYEAARTTVHHKRRGRSTTPDQLSEASAVRIREETRWYERNHDLFAGVLDTLVGNTIGMGVRAEPQVLDTQGNLCGEVNEAILQIQKEFHKRPEVTRSYDEFEGQRLRARTLFRDGEYLVQLLPGVVPFLTHGSDLPFSYEALEPDFLPYDFCDNNRRIFNGIEVNQWRQARRYWILFDRPESSRNMFTSSSQTKPINADRIIHGKTISRIGQLRGVSHFASTLRRFEDVKDYEDSERIAARIAAAVVGSIKRGPEAPAPAARPDGQSYQMSPGVIFDDLPADTEFMIHSSDRPNPGLNAYLRVQHAANAAGSRVSYSALSKNYEGSYSSRRQEAVEQYQIYGMLWGYFVSIDQVPMHEMMVSTAIAANLLRLPGNCDTKTIFDADFSRPALIQINPRDEAKAMETEISLEIMSKSQAIRSRNRSPSATMKQIELEQLSDGSRDSADEDN